MPPRSVVVAHGGVRDWRAYAQWPQVLRGLRDAGVDAPAILIGSDNGLPMRGEVLAANTGVTIIDRVGRRSLGEVDALTQRCALVLCVDSGLLHVARTADVPVVALFAGIIAPQCRMRAANTALSLCGAQTVNDASAAERWSPAPWLL